MLFQPAEPHVIETAALASDAAQLRVRMASDVGVDALDIAARLRAGALMMASPISVASGTKPA
jgi:hypothetical protein